MGDGDDRREVEVRALAAGPLAEPVGVEVAAGQQVGEQLAAHPLLGLRLGPAEQQHQGGDDRAALQGAPLGLLQRDAVHDQGAEVLAPARGHGHVGPGCDLDAAPGPPGRSIAPVRPAGASPAPASGRNPSSYTLTRPPSTSPSTSAIPAAPPPCSSTSVSRSWDCAARSTDSERARSSRFAGRR